MKKAEVPELEGWSRRPGWCLEVGGCEGGGGWSGSSFDLEGAREAEGAAFGKEDQRNEQRNGADLGTFPGATFRKTVLFMKRSGLIVG